MVLRLFMLHPLKNAQEAESEAVLLIKFLRPLFLFQKKILPKTFLVSLCILPLFPAVPLHLLHKLLQHAAELLIGYRL